MKPAMQSPSVSPVERDTRNDDYSDNDDSLDAIADQYFDAADETAAPSHAKG